MGNEFIRGVWALSVIDIATKRQKQIQASERVVQESERIKFMTVQAVLNAFDTMGLSEVDRGFWWLHNYINNTIQGFFEHNIGIMNVPPETKNEAAARIKKESEKLKKSKAVRVNQKKTEKEAQAMIIKISEKSAQVSEKRNEQAQKEKALPARQH